MDFIIAEGCEHISTISLKQIVEPKRRAAPRVFFVVYSLLLAAVVSVVYGSISIIIGEVFGLVILLFLLRKLSNRAVKILIIIKPILILAMLIVYYGNIARYGAPYYHGGSDDLHFEEIAKIFIQMDMYYPWDYYFRTNQNGFYWIISMLMRLSAPLGGYHTISYRMLNINLLLSIAAVTYTIFRGIGTYTDKQSRIVLCIVALFPNAIYISCHVFRDTLYTLIIMVSFALMDDIFHTGGKTKENLITKNKVLAWSLLVFTAFCGYWVRTETLIFILGMLLLSIVMKKELRLKQLYFCFILALTVIIAMKMCGILDYIFDKMQRYSIYLISNLNENGNVIYNTIFTLPILPFGWCARVLFGLVTPLPTAVLQSSEMFKNGLIFFDVLIAYGTIIQILVLPFLFSKHQKWDKYLFSFLILFLGVVLVTFTFRHFLIIYPLMAILILRTYFVLNCWKRIFMIFFSFIILCLFGWLYLVL